MPRHPRALDFVDQQIDLRERVRNLETGVHPVRALANFYASTPLATIPRDTLANSGILSSSDGGTARWMKRSGYILLVGGLQLDGPTASGGTRWGFMPVNARPALTLRLSAAATEAPYRAWVIIHPDGELLIDGSGLPTGISGAIVSLDGLGWPQG